MSFLAPQKEDSGPPPVNSTYHATASACNIAVEEISIEGNPSAAVTAMPADLDDELSRVAKPTHSVDGRDWCSPVEAMHAQSWAEYDEAIQDYLAWDPAGR